MTPRTDLTIIQVRAVRDMLHDQFEDDERGWLDCLEGETDLFVLASRILDRIEAEEGDKAALAAQMEARKIRRDRCDVRIKAQREALMALMECAGINRLALPEATVSLRQVNPKAIVTDEAALPDEYCTFSRKPDLLQIRADFGEDGVTIPGVAFDNGGTSITVRRK